MEAEAIEVEVAYAASATQTTIKSLLVDPATKVEEAIVLSGILSDYPDLDLKLNKVGIFGQIVTLQQCLRAGDRIEIYRPLQKNPMDARREKSKT